MTRPITTKLLEQLGVVLEEAEIASVQDPALPGFVIPWEKGEKRLGIYACVPFDGGLVVRTAVPIELESDQVLGALALCNEVNRRIPYGTASFCLERSVVQVRLGRTIFGSLLAEEALSQIGMVRDLAFSLFGPVRLLAAGESDVSVVVKGWEEAVRDLDREDQEETIPDPTE